MVYYAWINVNTFGASLNKPDRKVAKKALENLIYVISLWVGVGPDELYKPINDLAQAIKEKVLTRIDKAHEKHDVDEARNFLFSFLLRCDTGVTWQALNETVASLETWPAQVVEKESSMLYIDTLI